jgi:hypothetical protein
MMALLLIALIMFGPLLIAAVACYATPWAWLAVPLIVYFEPTLYNLSQAATLFITTGKVTRFDQPSFGLSQWRLGDKSPPG